MDKSDQYTSVLTRNAFSMLDDDAPVEVAAAPKKVEPKVQPVVQPKKTEKPSRQNDREDRPRSGKGGKGREEGKGGKGREGGRGRGKGKGGKGGKGDGADRPPREGKREFDRHESGNGRDRSQKRNGAGKYNWGTDGEQAADGIATEQQQRPPRRQYNRDERPERPRRNRFTEGEEKPAAAPTEDEEKATETTEVVEETVEEPAVPEEVTPPEPEVIGYDEYLAQKAAAAVDNDKKATRVVSNDDSRFKGQAFTKAEEVNEYAFDGGKKMGPKKGAARSKKTAKHLDAFAADAPASTTTRGKGGKGKGGKGKGGKGGRGTKFNLSTTDESQFPTLGGKK